MMRKRQRPVQGHQYRVIAGAPTLQIGGTRPFQEACLRRAPGAGGEISMTVFAPSRRPVRDSLKAHNRAATCKSCVIGLESAGLWTST